MNRKNFSSQGLSVKTRFTLILFLVAIGAVLSIAIFSWASNRDTLNAQAITKLEAIRATRAVELQRYIRAMRSQIEMLTEDDMFITAMVDFNRMFEELNTTPIPPDWDDALQAYYEKEYLPRLVKNIVGEPVYESYRPRSQASRYLQYQYLVANAAPFDRKGSLVRAEDESKYTVIHARYQDYFRRFIATFRYEDLYFVNYDNGQIVYSVQKRPDFATSLTEGAYRRSGLADVVAAVQANPTRRSLSIVDFQPYQPLLAAPAGFIAGPIYNGLHIVGILAFQLPSAEINRVLNADRQWAPIGLGETGEVYLVGSDLLMRSNARLFIENPDQYKARLKAMGVSDASLTKLEQFNTTGLLQTINTASARAALSGESGTILTSNYLGDWVLSSYEPVDIGGARYALITEMRADEILQPISTLQRQLIVATSILILLIVFLSIVLSTWLLRPLTLLVDGLPVDAHDQRVLNIAKRHDEFGVIAGTVGALIGQERAQRQQIETENRQRLALLTANLPTYAVERFTNGRQNFWELVPKVTVVMINLLDQAIGKPKASQVSEMMGKTEEALFNVAQRYDLELFTLHGGGFLAVSGLSTPHPDHIRRGVDFALAAVTTVMRLSTDAQPRTIQIGIETGPVFAGIPELRRNGFLVVGQTVQTAQALMNTAASNQIVITDVIQSSIGEYYILKQRTRDPLWSSVTGDTWLIEPHTTTDAIEALPSESRSS
jgi:class 3 adenylate cyclase